MSSSCWVWSRRASTSSCSSVYGTSFSSRNLAKFMIALRFRRSRPESGLHRSCDSRHACMSVQMPENSHTAPSGLIVSESSRGHELVCENGHLLLLAQIGPDSCLSVHMQCRADKPCWRPKLPQTPHIAQIGFRENEPRAAEHRKTCNGSVSGILLLFVIAECCSLGLLPA